MCDLSPKDTDEYRGSPDRPGKDSPFRNRSVAENLDLFARMRAGEYPDAARSLRAKIDKAGHIHGGRWLSLSVNQPGVPAVDGSNAAAHLVRSLSASDFSKTYHLDSKGYFSAQ